MSLPSPDTVNTAFHVLKKEECKQNLLNIYVALDQWLGEEGWLVGSFADALERGALTDESVLRCPHTEFLREISDGRLSGHPFFGGSAESTYFWEFPDPEDGRWFLEGQLNRREAKWRQLHVFGGDTPLVRCNYHGGTRFEDWLNLSFDGEVYVSDLLWEEVSRLGPSVSMEWMSGHREFARVKAIRSLVAYSGLKFETGLWAPLTSVEARPLVQLGHDTESGIHRYAFDCSSSAGRLFARASVRSLAIRIKDEEIDTSALTFADRAIRVRLKFAARARGEVNSPEFEAHGIAPILRHKVGEAVFWGLRINFVETSHSSGVGRWLTNKSFGPRESCFGVLDVAPHSLEDLVEIQIDSPSPMDRLALMESWADAATVEFITTFDVDSD